MTAPMSPEAPKSPPPDQEPTFTHHQKGFDPSWNFSPPAQHWPPPTSEFDQDQDPWERFAAYPPAESEEWPQEYEQLKSGYDQHEDMFDADFGGKAASQSHSSLAAVIMDEPESSTINPAELNPDSLQDWTAFATPEVYNATGPYGDSPVFERDSFLGSPPDSPTSFVSYTNSRQDAGPSTPSMSPTHSRASSAYSALATFREPHSPYPSSPKEPRFAPYYSPSLSAADSRSRSSSSTSELFRSNSMRYARNSPINKAGPIRHGAGEASQSQSQSQSYMSTRRRDRHRPNLSISISRPTYGPDGFDSYREAEAYRPAVITPQELHQPFSPAQPTRRMTHRHTQSLPVTPLFGQVQLHEERQATGSFFPMRRSHSAGVSALDDEIAQYVQSEDKLAMGERTVVLLNANIAQRSYGAERRRVVPPPMALLLGKPWWAETYPRGFEERRDCSAMDAPAVRPPQIFIEITSAANVSTGRCRTRWLSADGTDTDSAERSVHEPVIISGRAVAESCSAGQSQSEKTRITCTIKEPGMPGENTNVIGSFRGKPMVVVSKMPKRPSPAPGMCLMHGSVVALYHRSRTTSLRYLGVSGNHTLFPMMDWRSMTGGQSRSFVRGSDSSTFAAAQDSWDPFIIYAIDLDRTDDGDTQPDAAPYPSWPRPPVRALPYDPQNPLFLYYNQPVVLQCLSTAVVSPIMIIRRVEDNNKIIGGGTPAAPAMHPPPALAAVPGETLGDAVTPTRPVVFEIYKEPTGRSPPNEQERKTFLACFEDVIGLSHSDAVPKAYPSSDDMKNGSVNSSPASSPSLSTSSSSKRASPPRNPPSPLATRFDPSIKFEPPSPRPSSPVGTPTRQRMRHASSSSALSGSELSPKRPTMLSKAGARGKSTSAVETVRLFKPSGNTRKTEPPSCWSVDAADNCLWGIIGIDVSRFSFYIPQSLNSRNPSPFDHNSPSTPPSLGGKSIRPIISEEMPTVMTFTTANAEDVPATHDHTHFIVLKGEGLSSDLTVWLGPYKSTCTFCPSSTRLIVQDPLLVQAWHNHSPVSNEVRRIVLCRSDGVAFPTSLFYIPIVSASPLKSSRYPSERQLSSSHQERPPQPRHQSQERQRQEQPHQQENQRYQHHPHEHPHHQDRHPPPQYQHQQQQQHHHHRHHHHHHEHEYQYMDEYEDQYYQDQYYDERPPHGHDEAHLTPTSATFGGSYGYHEP